MPADPTVVFVAPGGRPLDATRVCSPSFRPSRVFFLLVAPRGLVSRAGVADEYRSLAKSAVSDRPTPALAALRLTRRRRSIVALHANGVGWASTCAARQLFSTGSRGCVGPCSRLSDTSARLGRSWAHRLPIIRWAAVSLASRQMLIDGGFAAPDHIVILPHPVDGLKIATRRPGEGTRALARCPVSLVQFASMSVGNQARRSCPIRFSRSLTPSAHSSVRDLRSSGLICGRG